MAHYDDFHGAYFTIQNIRKELMFTGNEDLLNRIEFVIVDNNPKSAHGVALNRFVKNNVVATNHVKMIRMEENRGTSVSRNRVMQIATGDFCLVMDCHVMLCPAAEVIKRLFQFMENNPDTPHIYSGPLVSDDLLTTHTHFNDVWSSGMWGQWGSSFACTCGQIFTGIKSDKCIIYRDLMSQEEIQRCVHCACRLPEIQFYGWRKKLKELGYTDAGIGHDQFEIPSQGLGTFFVKRDKWLGFNPHCRGFGGEEGYIHEKYRQFGHKAICLPFLKWLHRFARPDGVKYELTVDNKLRNYVLEFTELDLDLEPVHKEFVEGGKFDENKYNQFIEEAKSIYGK